MNPARIVLAFALAILVLPTGKARAGEQLSFLPGGALKRITQETSSRFRKSTYLGRAFPSLAYKGFTLIGNEPDRRGEIENRAFYKLVRRSIDLIEKKAPQFLEMMRAVNPTGRRVIFLTGRKGRAGFNAWGRDYTVRIPTTHIDPAPVFENTPYTLASTLVHELVGHGRQAMDKRIWPMVDWCGKDSGNIRGVRGNPKRKGPGSGLIEYEAHLYAKWFLNTVQGTYPNLNEAVVKRNILISKNLTRRFPAWYDEEKTPKVLLSEFGAQFRSLCPGLAFTPYPALKKIAER